MRSRMLTILTLSILVAAASVQAVALTPGAAPLDTTIAVELAGDRVRIIVGTDGPSATYAPMAEALGMTVTYRYEIIDAFAGYAERDLLPLLDAQPWSTRVSYDRLAHASLAVSRVEVGADKAEAAGYTGAGVNVAILDTGIESVHPALSGRITGCVQFSGGLRTALCEDDNGHGTHVAGIVGGSRTTLGDPGVATGVTFSAVKVLNSAGVGLVSDIIAGMDWIVQNKNVYGIRVMSASLGAAGCGDGTSDDSRAADRVMANGVVAVIAAGNEGPDKCTVGTPGDAKTVITVGAVDDRSTTDINDDVIAGFSSRGPTKDGRVKPEIVAPGVAIRSAFLGGTYVALSGTSMATPHVSGVVALMLEQNPSLSPAQVRDSIMKTGIQLPADGGGRPNNNYGYGFVNTCALLSLSGCSSGGGGAEPVPVHVSGIDLSYTHTQGGRAHKVSTLVSVAKADGSPAGGVTVSIRVTSPEGTSYTASGSTSGNGQVTLDVQQKGGGHGTWQSCVTSLSGAGFTYDEAANVATCKTISVS